MRLGPRLRRTLAVVALVAALVLGGLAFTRFDRSPAPQAGSPGYADFDARRIHDARVSVLLGLAASFVLLGSFALFQEPKPGPEAESGPKGP